MSSLRASAIDAHRQDNLDDIDDFIESRLRSPNLAERLVESGVALSTVKDQLRHKGEGNFLYVSQALRDIETDIYTFDKLDALPRGLAQWYEAWFHRKFPFPQKDYVNARLALEVMLAAAEPLTLDLLAVMTGFDSHYLMPSLMSALEPIVVEKNGTFSFYHKSVADWLITAYGPYRISIAAGLHRVLKYLGADLSRDPRDWGLYALRHALEHLAPLRFPDCPDAMSAPERDLLRMYVPLWNNANGSAGFHRTRVECGMDRLFISYVRRESHGLVRLLMQDLSAAGLRVWTDHVIRPGDNFVVELERAFGECDTVLVLAGQQSTVSVNDHIKSERTQACCQGKGILVLVLDRFAAQHWSRDGFPTVDFTEWETNYAKGLANLFHWLL